MNVLFKDAVKYGQVNNSDKKYCRVNKGAEVRR